MRINIALVVVAFMVLGACAMPSVPEPQHVVVVLDRPEPRHAERVAIDAFTRWASTDPPPESSFSICRPGDDRVDGRCMPPIIIPTEWGSNVRRAKATFLRQGTVIVSTGLRSSTSWPHAAELASAQQTTTVVRTSAMDSAATPIPALQHRVVICDASPSTRSSDGCSVEALLALYNAWLDRAEPTSSFTVLIVGNDLETTERIFAVESPISPDAERLLTLLGARAELGRLNLHRATNGSAVVESVFRAAEFLHARGGEKVLTLLTDGRQVSTVADFDTSIPAPFAFVDKVRAAALCAELPKDTAVQLCGLHYRPMHGTTKAVGDAAADRARRAAWTALFRALGAQSIELRTQCATSFLPGKRPSEDQP